MASIDKNLPALLDEQAYTVVCNYNRSKTPYTFVTNLRPLLQVGETVLVQEAASFGNAKEKQPSPTSTAVLLGARKTLKDIQKQYENSTFSDFSAFLRFSGNAVEYNAAKQLLANESGGLEELEEQQVAIGFVAVRVVEVHDRVRIEPGCDIMYKWVAGRVDPDYYLKLMARNQQIVDAYADAYTKNMRRSFATQVLGELDPNAANNIKALLAAPTAATEPFATTKAEKQDAVDKVRDTHAAYAR